LIQRVDYLLPSEALPDLNSEAFSTKIIDYSYSGGPACNTALRLGRFFGMSSEFWLGLQSQYDLDVAADALGDRLKKEVKEYSKVA
jgi:hypothetical protein